MRYISSSFSYLFIYNFYEYQSCMHNIDTYMHIYRSTINKNKISWFCGNSRVPHFALLPLSFISNTHWSAAIFLACPLSLYLDLHGPGHFSISLTKIRVFSSNDPYSVYLSQLPRISSSPLPFPWPRFPRGSRVYRSAQLLLRPLPNLALSSTCFGSSHLSLPLHLYVIFFLCRVFKMLNHCHRNSMK